MSENTAPSVTIEQVEAAIKSESFTVLPDGRTTVCQLTLYNDFTVEGYSACVSIENFNEEKGKKYSRERAVTKIWELLGFRLADQLHRKAIEAVFTERPTQTVQVAEEVTAITLGEQVLFYERVGDEVSPPMAAFVSQVFNDRMVSLTVLAPNGTTHGRASVAVVGPGEKNASVGLTSFACRK